MKPCPFHHWTLSFLAAFSLISLITVATAGEPSPLHSLVQDLEGNFSGLPTQDDPRFGHAVAMFGDTLAVGAPNTLDGSDQRGAVFIYRRQNGEWTLRQRLQPVQSGDVHCGASVALSEYFLVVGCPRYPRDELITGAALVYSRSAPGAEFQAQQVLFPEDVGDAADEGAECGHSVSIFADSEAFFFPLAALGCPRFSAADLGKVEIHFFCPLLILCPTYSSAGWHRADTLMPSAVTEHGHDGSSVSLNLNGDQVLLAVGAPDVFPDSDGGRVRVWRMGNTVFDWNLETSFQGTPGSRFGASVHMRDFYLLIGAPERRANLNVDPSESAAVGSITIFSGGCSPDCGWSQPDEIVGETFTPEPVSQNRLGQAVQVLEGRSPKAGFRPRMLAGEPHYPLQDAEGRARHYRWAVDGWEFIDGEPLYQAGMPEGSEFGFSLASDEDWVAIGTPGYSEPGANPMGRVRVYAWDNDFFGDRFEQ